MVGFDALPMEGGREPAAGGGATTAAGSVPLPVQKGHGHLPPPTRDSSRHLYVHHKRGIHLVFTSQVCQS